MNEDEIKKAAEEANDAIFETKRDTESINIDYLLRDILRIKMESLNNPTIFGYADHLETQLYKIKLETAEFNL